MKPIFYVALGIGAVAITAAYYFIGGIVMLRYMFKDACTSPEADVAQAHDLVHG